MLSVAILAGGLATRLKPLTETIPKSLVDVAGRPFIAWQLDYLQKQGAHRVVLCIGHHGEQIEQVVGNGDSFGLDVTYSHDGPQLLGTGGALRKALPLLGDQFLVFYGDSYLPVNFGAVEDGFNAQCKPALITVLKNGGRWDKSNVFFHNGRLIEYNKRNPHSKMAYIDYGLGVLSASTLADRPAGSPFDLADVYYELSLCGQLAGYEVFERFYEIGSHEGLDETIQFLTKRKRQ